MCIVQNENIDREKKVCENQTCRKYIVSGELYCIAFELIKRTSFYRESKTEQTLYQY